MVCFMISWKGGTFLTSMVLKIDAVVFVGIQCKSTACIPKSYCNNSHRIWYIIADMFSISSGYCMIFFLNK